MLIRNDVWNKMIRSASRFSSKVRCWSTLNTCSAACNNILRDNSVKNTKYCQTNNYFCCTLHDNHLNNVKAYYHSWNNNNNNNVSSIIIDDDHSSSFGQHEWIQIDSDIRDAIRNKQPVVALESTIIAHGMPYPQNIELFHQMKDILIQKGVTPALIAIKDGVCRVGLSTHEVTDLGTAGESGRAIKCSTREISMLLSKQALFKKNMTTTINQNTTNNDQKTMEESQWGATTVASTMRIAHMAGISTFVTGGIGGVHRGCEQTMDISTDVIELSRTPVIVISAGIKSILDIGKTLEVLETYGIPTIGYQTNDFPAFFSSKSGYKVPIRMDTPEEIATAYHIAKDLHMNHGFLVAVPNHDPAGEFVEEAIQNALNEAITLGIQGPAVTPYILRRVSELSKGDSLRSNASLALNNTIVGADIAIAISEQMKHRQQGRHRQIVNELPQYSEKTISDNAEKSSSIVVIGGIVVDMIAKPSTELVLYTSNPSICYESDGGVGRNIVEVLCHLGSRPLFFSVVGNDSRGQALLNRMHSILPGTEKTIEVLDDISNEYRTATYLAILNEAGDLHTACADMNILERIPIPPKDVIDNASIIVMDGNPSVSILQETAVYAHSVGVKVYFEPTSVVKARKVGKNHMIMSSLTYSSPNLDEFFAMSDVDEVEKRQIMVSASCIDDILSSIRRIAEKVLYGMNSKESHLIITCGEMGVILASKTSKKENIENEKDMIISFQTFSSPININVQNATGAGDTLAGAVIHALVNGKTLPDAIEFGIAAASYSLQYSKAAISPLISKLQGTT